MPETKEKLNNNPQDKADNDLPIAQLYPELNQSQLAEAEYFLNRFLEVMHDIFEENQREKRD